MYKNRNKKNLSFYIMLVCFFTFRFLALKADFTSTKGSISFDTNNNGQFEATLNQSGLGIGANSPSANLHVEGNAIISNQLLIGTTQGSSILQINGSIGFGIESINSNTSLGGNSTVMADTSSSDILIAMPDASENEGLLYNVFKINSSNNLILSGGRIDDADHVQISSGTIGSLGMIASGNQWYLLYKKNATLTSTSNLVGYWSFNESLNINTTKDHTSYASNFSLSNYVTSGNSHISGKVGNAITFDGSDDIASLTDPSDGHLDVPSNGALSVSFWLKTTHTSGTYIIDKGASSGFSGYNLYSYGTGLRWYARDSTTTKNASYTYNFFNDTWNHIVGVFVQSGNIYMYVNGTAVDTADMSTLGSIASIRDLSLSNGGVAYSGNMAIDELKIYNKELSASEILAIYNREN